MAPRGDAGEHVGINSAGGAQKWTPRLREGRRSGEMRWRDGEAMRWGRKACGMEGMFWKGSKVGVDP